LSGDTAIAEKFVDHRPSLSQFLMDMKLMYWLPPTAMPAVGMMPFSVGENLTLLMICLESPGAHEGELEAATVLDNAPSRLRNSTL
jgi:hypothetical protein